MGESTETTGNRFKFTKRGLERTEPGPGGKRVYYWDTEHPGLALAVSRYADRRDGHVVRTFYFRRKINRESFRVRLGTFPEMDLRVARQRATRLAAALDKSALDGAARVPEEFKVRNRESPTDLTLAEAYAEYRERHLLNPHNPRSAKTIAGYDWQFEKHLAKSAGKRLSRISRADVQELHERVGRASGPYMANRVLALLRAILARAKGWGFLEGDNPAAGIEKYPEATRDRFLKDSEVGAFFRALDGEPNETARDCITMMLFTGARRSNVQAMRWQELDLYHAVWRIPQTKSGQPQDVPLVDEAVELLRRREAKRGREGSQVSEFVFPGRGKTGHVAEVRYAFKRVLERAGLDDGLRLHDLRRTLGSWMASGGESLLVIGKALGHRSTAATEVYSRVQNEPVRTATQRAVSALLEAARREPEKPIPLRGREESGGS